MRPILILLMFLPAAVAAQSTSTGGDEPAASDNTLIENRGAGQDRWWEELPLPEWSAFERVEVGSKWFDVYRLDDDLFAIYEPGQYELVISYLIVGRERALLFDTGLGIGDIRAVVEQLTDKGVVVLNSHSHYDHIGGNQQFDEILGLDNPYTKQNAAGSTPEAIAEFIGPGWVARPLPEGFEPAEWRTRPYTITRTVRDGERIDLGGRTFEVLETPGHAPDAICLLDRENRVLFTGDTFYLAPLYAHLPGSDPEAYRKTAARLAALASEVDTLVTAHNVPYASSGYLVEMRDAFERIAAGDADFVSTDGNREYAFGDFSIILPEPAAD
jgi:glyoxylase-like metal-dependent hydrolase (beta-lactamase superfamily II)